MSERLTWFPCYPSKLLGALAGMRPDEGYIYWIVCLRIYEVNGPCPDTLDALARRSGMNKRRVTDALDLSFRAGRLVRVEGGIMNPFASEVLADSRALREERKRAGQEGGKRSAEKRKEKQQATPSKASNLVQQPSTHLQLQDSLFPEGNRAQTKSEAKPAKPMTELEIQRKQLFDRGKEVLGQSAGGMVQSLLAVKHGNISLARAAIEQASTMDNPREYIGGILRGGGNGANRNGSGQKLGFAEIAERVRRGGRAPGNGGEAPLFGDACDPQPGGGRQDPGHGAQPMERDGKAPLFEARPYR